MDEQQRETPGQMQARLRREKRAAKITANGSDRLAKITGVSGRPAPASEDVPLIKPDTTPSISLTAPDPDEVDISEHYWSPSPSRLTPHTNQNQTPSSLNSSPSQNSDDPIARMMQQMLSGITPIPSPGASPNGLPDISPLLHSLFGSGPTTSAPGQNTNNTNPPPPLSSSLFGPNLFQSNTANPSTWPQQQRDMTYIWKIIHAIFSMILAIYISWTTPGFNGSKASRHISGISPDGTNRDVGARLFYVFATAETILQTTRYFLEKGQLKGSGWLATIAGSGFVPEPWGSWLRIVGRYGTIWSTLLGDVMVVVFILGAVAWWRGKGNA